MLFATLTWPFFSSKLPLDHAPEIIHLPLPSLLTLSMHHALQTLFYSCVLLCIAFFPAGLSFQSPSGRNTATWRPSRRQKKHPPHFGNAKKSEIMKRFVISKVISKISDNASCYHYLNACFK